MEKHPAVPRIHLFEINNRRVSLNADRTEWESGFWSGIGEERANALIGGAIYFHRRQHLPSYGGGQIISWRIASHDEAFPGTYVFRYRLMQKFMDFAGIKATGNWAGGGVWLAISS